MQIGFMVSMDSTYGIDGAREVQVIVEGVLHMDGSTQIGRIGAGSQDVVTVGDQLVGRIVASAHSSFRSQVVGDVCGEGVLCLSQLCTKHAGGQEEDAP